MNQMMREWRQWNGNWLRRQELCKSHFAAFLLQLGHSFFRMFNFDHLAWERSLLVTISRSYNRFAYNGITRGFSFARLGLSHFLLFLGNSFEKVLAVVVQSLDEKKTRLSSFDVSSEIVLVRSLNN